jgi:hypothetical protein
MIVISPSSYTKPAPGLRVKQGAPAVPRPTPEDIERFPKDAEELLDSIWSKQNSLLDRNRYDLNWVKEAHFVLAGATGPGLGGALSSAVLNLLQDGGSLTVIARDLSRSVGYHTGRLMSERAEKAGFGSRFRWINDGLALEGDRLHTIINALKDAGAQNVVYINTVAAASSGLLPGSPPVFVKDVDEEGLFQWELQPLDEKKIKTTQFIMGEMAVQFTDVLEQNGINVAATAFADWRASMDVVSRDPSSVEYGRNGPYSTSLHLPKIVLQKATSDAYNTDRLIIDFFLPVMRTRALGFIPGGSTLHHVLGKMMKLEGVPHVDIPELALGMLERIGRALTGAETNPFPRHDEHEAQFDLWFYEVLKHLNNDKTSDFYYNQWIKIE